MFVTRDIFNYQNACKGQSLQNSGSLLAFLWYYVAYE